MKRKIGFLCTLLIFSGFIATAYANTYTFTNTTELTELQHQWVYTWGIDLDLSAGETIESATLYFYDIYNNLNASNILYVHLLNSASTGVTSTWEGFDLDSSDYYDTQEKEHDLDGELLTTWTDLPGFHWEEVGGTFIKVYTKVYEKQDISYSFTGDDIASLMEYLADGNFGIGIDSDCVYNNTGVKLIIETTTAPVPEPATLFLLGSGLLGVVGLRKKKK